MNDGSRAVFPVFFGRLPSLQKRLVRQKRRKIITFELWHFFAALVYFSEMITGVTFSFFANGVSEIRRCLKR